jgi:hypothetical protein
MLPVPFVSILNAVAGITGGCACKSWLLLMSVAKKMDGPIFIVKMG